MGRTAYTPLLASKRKFQQHGKSGMWVSDWYPEIANCVDDLALFAVATLTAEPRRQRLPDEHGQRPGRPALPGVVGDLRAGQRQRNLPGYVVLLDYRRSARRPRNWCTGFMPSTYQGTRFRDGKTPILDLQPRPGQAPSSRAQARLHPGTQPAHLAGTPRGQRPRSPHRRL